MSENTPQVINNDESIVNTQQHINNDKWQAKSALDDDECIVKLNGELDILSQLDFSPSKNGYLQTFSSSMYYATQTFADQSCQSISSCSSRHHCN